MNRRQLFGTIAALVPVAVGSKSSVSTTTNLDALAYAKLFSGGTITVTMDGRQLAEAVAHWIPKEPKELRRPK